MFSLLLLSAYAAASFLEPIVALVLLVFEHPQLAGAILGLLTPLLVSAIKQPGLSTTQRRLIAYAAALVVGALTVLASGGYTGADLVSTLLITIAASQAAYAELWKPSGAAAAVEKRTSLAPRRTFAVIADPGQNADDVLHAWRRRVLEAGWTPLGDPTVRTSYEAGPDGVLVAEGPVKRV